MKKHKHIEHKRIDTHIGLHKNRQREQPRYQINIEAKPRICTVTELLHSDQDFKKVCLQFCRTVEKLGIMAGDTEYQWWSCYLVSTYCSNH